MVRGGAEGNQKGNPGSAWFISFSLGAASRSRNIIQKKREKKKIRKGFLER